MATYYFAETSNARALCQAQPLKAQTLTAAKREASLRKLERGTTLILATAAGLSSYGFILDRLAVKTCGKWADSK